MTEANLILELSSGIIFETVIRVAGSDQVIGKVYDMSPQQLRGNFISI
ncbi:MAG: hypothetical protein RSE13_05920 [Planktothrix sp. GU0601_MAG3]|nr:MAG: hypothetical protein RSE13_05920 [Planktothrix sp. GU0601_MAG3]